MESPGDGCCDHGDFGFAFNDSNFSDRVLRICIYSEPIESTHESPSAAELIRRRTSGRVKTLHISSPILAGRSPFFYKLFSNGMRESEESHITLRINDSEEASLMEVLKFMYTNRLTVTTGIAVLDVLKAADKFDVASCMRHCSRVLRNLRMTPEFVLAYLNLPSTILMAASFQPLTVAAKQFYAVHYKDITKFQNEILSLPLADVETIIASDDLQVKSEDEVYDFVLKWACTHFPETKDRREIITNRLSKFIRYPYMNREKLRHLFYNDDFDPEFVKKVILEAILFKTELPARKQGDGNTNPDRRFVERAYKYRPIKMVEFEKQSRHGVVYMELKREMCASLFPSGIVFSNVFPMGGEWFQLMARCEMDSFGLFLCMKEREAGSFEFEFEFAARLKSAQEFVSKFKRSAAFKNRIAIGTRNLFAIPWTWFIEEDSDYFIDGVLDLRVELTIKD